MFALRCSDSSTLSRGAPAAVSGALFLRLLKPDRAGADRNPVAVFQRMLKSLFAVDEDVVGAPFDLPVHHYAVNNHERTVVGRLNVRVVARRARIIEHNLIVGRAPDHARRLGIKLILALATAGVGGS